MSVPRVSVCVPTHGRRNDLMTTLSLMREQTYRDYQLLVCDDASRDDTWNWLGGLDWPELRAMRNEENRGLAGTLERLFGEAKGELIMIHHDHDRPEPTLIESMVTTLDRHPTAGFACAAYHILRNDGTVVLNPDIEEFRLFPPDGLVSGRTILRRLAFSPSTPLCANGAIFRKAVVDAAGGYRAAWGLAADEDLYRRVAARADVAFCRERLFYLRERPPESREAMGGWRGLLTLKSFRSDTARNFLFRTRVAALIASSYVTTIQWLRICRETAHLSIRGGRERLKKSKQERDRVTPAGPVFSPIGRMLFVFVITAAGRLGPVLRAGYAVMSRNVPPR